MINQRTLPQEQNTDMVTHTILVNGKKLPLEYKRLYAMTVSKEVNKIPFARIVLGDGDVAEQDWDVSNQSFFEPGNEIEIQAGYHSEEETIFKGIVVKQSIEVRRKKNSILTIECKSPAVRMTVGRNSQYFDTESDADAIEDIFRKYNLKNTVEEKDSYPKRKEIVQYRVSDWDFIVSRADLNGKLTFVNDDEIVVAKPNLNQDPALRLAYGAGVFEFKAELNAEHQYAAVTASAWNYIDQEVVKDESQNLSFSEQGNMSTKDLSDVIGLEALKLEHSGAVTVQELRAWANAKMTRSLLAKICGQIKIRGYAQINPGELVNLQGFGDRYNGNTFVSKVHHEFNVGMWYTVLKFGLSHEFFTDLYKDIVEAPAAGLTSPINGLQIGTVTQMHDDPDGQFRVKVKIPIINNDMEGIWARVAFPDAGKDPGSSVKRGAFFMPEIGDEVVVGFINDDPREAIVMGSLYSNDKQAAPFDPAESNPIKGFATKTEMKFFFDDDNETITLETSNGNTIVIDNQNDEIRIESRNSILISADQSVDINATDINLNATNEVVISGTSAVRIN